MSLDDFLRDVKAYLYDRTSSPLVISFIVSWVLWNWQFVLVFFSSMDVMQKISYAKNSLYPTWWSIAPLIIGPMASVYVFIRWLPWLEKRVFRFWRSQQNELKAVKLEVDKEVPISKEERDELVHMTTVMVAQLKSDLSKKEREIDRLNRVISRLNKELSESEKNGGVKETSARSMNPRPEPDNELKEQINGAKSWSDMPSSVQSIFDGRRYVSVLGVLCESEFSVRLSDLAKVTKYPLNEIHLALDEFVRIGLAEETVLGYQVTMLGRKVYQLL